MRKLPIICAMSGLGVFVGLTPAAARSSNPPPFVCNGTYTNRIIETRLDVPPNGACVLNYSHVTGDVRAADNAYFESNHSVLEGEVIGNGALTLFVRNRSKLMGNILASHVSQVFVYDSHISDSVASNGTPAPGYGHFQVCGSRVGNSISATGIGPDILVGDPAGGCAANTLDEGDISIYRTSTYAELTVRSNTLRRGGLRVTRNEGSARKFVQANRLPMGRLDCSANQAPFVGSPNGARATTAGGQCS